MSTPTVRPMFWSVRREVWENRSIYKVPVIVAIVFLFGFLISTIGMPSRRRAVSRLDEAHQRGPIEAPYDAAAGMLIVTSALVGFFYCLDALHGERRDRSILFWKSLPVSDTTTVLAKAGIPMVVLPLITLVTIAVTQTIIAMLSTVILLGGGLSPSTIFPQLRFIPSPLVLLYALPAVTLWYAPIYAWLLLVSGWAKRATFLWAVLPPAALAAFEKIAFNTQYVGLFLRYRLAGWVTRAFVDHPKGSPAIDPLTAMTPGHFLLTPGLWIGLLFAAAMLFVTIRMRRYREPI
jgi:ABC-2 type transport system permease protein